MKYQMTLPYMYDHAYAYQHAYLMVFGSVTIDALKYDASWHYVKDNWTNPT